MGLRFGVTGAWLALVVVEQINATSGIGYMINLAGSYGQINIVLVGLVLYAILGFASDAIVRLIQKRALSWQRTFAN
jgi:sulfonate transport system permease protein